MLIEFFGENFGCFRDEFRLSMVATDIDPDNSRGVVEVKIEGDPEPLKLLRCAAIYGPNASGKSTVLKAAQAMKMIVQLSGQFRSDQKIIPYKSFGGVKSEKHPTRLGLKAVINGAVYHYEFTYTSSAIIKECLMRETGEISTVLFERVNQSVSGEWSTDEQFKLALRDFRPNALILSLADILTPQLVGEIASNLTRKLIYFDCAVPGDHYDFIEQAAAFAEEFPDFKSWLLEQLQAADIGVTNLTVKKHDNLETDQETLHHDVDRLVLSHSGHEGSFDIPFKSESLGTKKLVDLAPLLFELSSGKGVYTFFVDEIGASMHPNLLIELIRNINCGPKDSSAHSQLIFATHETCLIDGEARDAILRRDQVYFTEKNSKGEARLYSMSDFKERQNVNLRKRYLEGRYGAIPALGTFPG